MSDDIVAALTRWVTEALDLRFGADMPGAHASPQEIRDALVDVRGRLDRVEQLYGQAIRVKAAARTGLDATVAIADDAWDQAVTTRRTAPVARGDEYSTARERHAYANLDTLDLRRSVRDATEFAHVCAEKTEVLRLAFRGLADARGELLAVLRSLQFESVLDR